MDKKQAMNLLKLMADCYAILSTPDPEPQPEPAKNGTVAAKKEEAKV